MVLAAPGLFQILAHPFFLPPRGPTRPPSIRGDKHERKIALVRFGRTRAYALCVSLALSLFLKLKLLAVKRQQTRDICIQHAG